LIRKSDLNYVKDNYIIPLTIFLFYKEEENLRLNKTTFKYLIKNSNLDMIYNLDLSEECNFIIYNKLKEIQSEIKNKKLSSKIELKQEVKKKFKI
jgi:hypothetical protein